MERAIEVGRSARFWSAPNPAVGCVLSKGDTVIGTGFTQPAGRQHAEIMALAEASDPRGATAYVTLEPCSHVGKTGRGSAENFACPARGYDRQLALTDDA